jgi:23S rRNA (uracil1939-C5)-methyltransferase
MSKRQAPVQKNEVYEMIVNDLGINGEGIGKVEGYTLFVDGGLPGEKIKVKVVKIGKNFGFGKLEEILEPSPDRVEPICKIANKCGGCQLQHLSYEGQLKFKHNKVSELMKRIGKLEDVAVNPVIGMDEPYYYRNKVQYPVRSVNGEIKIGFYAKRSHRVVETDHCYIQDQRNETIRELILDWMEQNDIPAYNEEKHVGFVRHIVTRHAHSTKKMHVTLVINGRRLKAADSLIARLSKLDYISGISVNINKEETNVIMSDHLLHIYGDTYIEDTIGDIKFHISPLSFFQVNPVQTEKLYNKALEYAGLTGTETVIDAYCGIGSISLFLAKKAKKVIGVEVAETAIADAVHNAEINGIKNVEFHVGKAEEVIPNLYKDMKIKADVILVDPPRKGCEEALLSAMVQIAPKKIVYVSCDPATLARDLHYLTEHGYEVKQVQPVDMFPQGVHVECCALLTKR